MCSRALSCTFSDGAEQRAVGRVHRRALRQRQVADLVPVVVHARRSLRPRDVARCRACTRSASPRSTAVPRVVLVSPAGLAVTFVPGAGMVASSLTLHGAELLFQRGGLIDYVKRGKTFGVPLLHPWANRLDGLRYEAGRPHGRDRPGRRAGAAGRQRPAQPRRARRLAAVERRDRHAGRRGGDGPRRARLRARAAARGVPVPAPPLGRGAPGATARSPSSRTCGRTSRCRSPSAGTRT